jgi:hypothetical protein
MTREGAPVPTITTTTTATRLGGEHGEGVISTAIAVLIMAIIGLAMWVTFDRVFDNAGEDIEDNIEQIG